MRILYLDDSGKIHPNDVSLVAVFAGFSVDEGSWHTLLRQISGAKAHFFRNRGNPNDWEIKSADYLTPNNWRRANKRRFCFEIARVLERNRCRVYCVSMEKARAVDALEEAKFLPLALQRLLAKFNDEIVCGATTGSIVLDWSTHKMDRHITNCVTSMSVTRSLEFLRVGVTYGSSLALPPLQVADLIAGTLRRSLEGQVHLFDLAEAFRELRYQNVGALDMNVHPWTAS